MKRALWSGFSGVLLVALSAACSGGGGGGDANREAGVDSGEADGSSALGDGEPTDGGSGADATTGDANPDVPHDQTPPTFAGATSATTLGETRVSIAWAAATDDATPQAQIAYRIYVATSQGAEDYTMPYATSPAGASGAVVVGLHAGTKYHLVVRAVDRAGNEDTNTVEVSATTTDVTPPFFAGAQSVTGTTETSALVSWNPATDNASQSDEIHYDVYASQTQGGEDFSNPTLVTASGATSATLTGLSQAAPVYVVVRAVDGAGNEDTNGREVTGATLDTTPPTFTGVSSAVPNGTSVLLSWTQAGDPFIAPSTIVYDVYVASAAGQENFTTPSFTTAAGASSFTVSNLTILTTYYFVVRARDQYGNEDSNTTELSAMTQDTDPPTFAGLTSATATSPTTIKLTWNGASEPGTGAKEFIYYVYGGGAASFEDYTSALTNTTGYSTSPVNFTVPATPGATHCYVVRAKNTAGVLDSNTVEQCATTPATAPTFTVQPSITGQTATTISLTWTATSNPPTSISYLACSSTTSGSCATFTTGTSSATNSVTITGLSPSTTYYFVVQATDSGGSTYSMEVPGTTTSVVAPGLSGSVTCDAAATETLPSYLSVSFPAATGGTYSVASYEICTTTSSTGCSPFVATATATAAGPTLVGAPANGVGTETNGSALASFQNYYVFVRALDTVGTPSGVISSATPCSTAPSYTDDLLAYMTTSCNSSSCHGNGTLPGPWSYAYWQANTPPNFCKDGGSPAAYVVSGDAADSLMYQAVANTYGSCTGIPQMPLGGVKNSPWGRGTNETMIQEWINDGANLN
jgi:hypothetical protein